MPDEKFEKWLNSLDLRNRQRIYKEGEIYRVWTAALASRSTTPGKLEELIDGLEQGFKGLAEGAVWPAAAIWKQCANDVSALKPALREAVDAEVAATYAKGASDMAEVAQLKAQCAAMLEKAREYLPTFETMAAVWGENSKEYARYVKFRKTFIPTDHAAALAEVKRQVRLEAAQKMAVWWEAGMGERAEEYLAALRTEGDKP